MTEKLSYPDDDPGLGGAHTKYLLLTKEGKFQVTQDIFNQASVNDLIIVHGTFKSKTTIKTELVTSSVKIIIG